MPIRFTDPIDLALLNKLAQDVDSLNQRVNALSRSHTNLSSKVNEVDSTTDKLYFNTTVLSWNGSTNTVSWTNSYLKDKQGKILQIPAGSRAGLSSSTAYHVAWNPVHKQMCFAPDLTTILPNKNNYYIGQITTGTTSQIGTAGGGGTDGGGTGLPRKFDEDYTTP